MRFRPAPPPPSATRSTTRPLASEAGPATSARSMASSCWHPSCRRCRTDHKACQNRARSAQPWTISLLEALADSPTKAGTAQSCHFGTSPAGTAVLAQLGVERPQANAERLRGPRLRAVTIEIGEDQLLL